MTVVDAKVAEGRVLAIIGPPSSGKHTIAGHVVAHHGGIVFDLRTYARVCAEQDCWAGQMITAAETPGRYPDAAVYALLYAALVCGGVYDPQYLTALVGVPATLAELCNLRSVVGRCGADLTIVELTADDRVLHRRAARRRICLSCAPDADGGLHNPAPANADPADVCGCGALLAVRRRDTPARLNQRILAYRNGRAAVHAAARMTASRWVDVNADDVPAVVADNVRAVLHDAGTPRLALRGGRHGA